MFSCIRRSFNTMIDQLAKLNLRLIGQLSLFNVPPREVESLLQANVCS